jgi:hypothetical protein
MMMAVLQATNPNLFGIWDIEDFGDLLGKFRSSGLLNLRYGHAIHDDTRHLIVPHLKYNETKKYRKAHTAALRVYRDWLGRPVDNRSLYVREEIYHFASLNPRKDLKPVLSDRVKEYPLWLRDVAFCDRALETLWHYIDEDIELRDLSSQVPALLDLVSNSF